MAGIGRWRVLARRRGQAPLSKGQAVERRSRDAAARAGAPAQGAGPSVPAQCWRCASMQPLRRGGAIRGRQDSRAVHDSSASDGENAPWRQDVRAVYSSTALCGAFCIRATHILPKIAVFEYTQAIYCHEPVFFPSEAPSGTHQGTILPRPAAWERIGAISCHGRQLGNASGRYLAIAMRRMIATEVHRRPILDCNGQVMLNSHSSASSIVGWFS